MKIKQFPRLGRGNGSQSDTAAKDMYDSRIENKPISLADRFACEMGYVLIKVII